MVGTLTADAEKIVTSDWTVPAASQFSNGIAGFGSPTTSLRAGDPRLADRTPNLNPAFAPEIAARASAQHPMNKSQTVTTGRAPS